MLLNGAKLMLLIVKETRDEECNIVDIFTSQIKGLLLNCITWFYNEFLIKLSNV